MDNKMFNVNGRTKEQLEMALDCFLFDEYGKELELKGWSFRKDKGFVLHYYVRENDKNSIVKSFTDRMGNEKPIKKDELVEVLWEWLNSQEADEVVLDGQEIDLDHDGHNKKGWRLYTEDWGHIKNKDGSTIDHSTLGAFKPCYCWYGK
jgi:hypothetical protein